MAKKQSILSPIIRITFTFLVLCGLVYPLIITGIAQAVMKDNADGSLIYNDKNEVIGSKLIGQNFTDHVIFMGVFLVLNIKQRHLVQITMHRLIQI